jgi:hypothetical protein
VVTLNVYAAGLVALYAAGLYHAVQAAEAAGTLTLACDGMKTTQPSVPDPKPDAVSMGITLDFTARRVDGFGSDAGLRLGTSSKLHKPPRIRLELARDRRRGQPSALRTAGLWPDSRAVVLCRPNARG